MEKLLQDELGLEYVKPTSYSSGGCINNGRSYETDQGWYYLKYNTTPQSYEMFLGEYHSLKAIHDTNTVKVPNPIRVLRDSPLGAVLVAEHLDIHSLRSKQVELGTKLAQMHKHNIDSKLITKFGFDETTCCGSLPLDNSWKNGWIEFYAENRLKVQVDMLIKERNKSSCGDLNTLYELLLRKIGSFFDGIQVFPSLLHGDLWSGNVGETEKEPVIFDPGSFYGHSEFEFGIASMFGGFSQAFYNSYFEVLPKEKGFDKRNMLYELFHQLNHWNHFGSGYKSSSISILKQLTK